MAPTFDTTSHFDKEFKRLTGDEQEAFKKAVAKFVEDLRENKEFRKSLRVKKFQGATGVFEITWAENGRALFAYGQEKHKGKAHIIWLSIGGHEIFRREGWQ